MAILEEFPQTLLDEHGAWHMGGQSKINPGLDFLNFHRAFLAKVFDWFGKQPAAYQAKYDLSSWIAIPTELKTDPATGWNAAYAGNEQRILTLSPAFSGEDEFGWYIQHTIHNNWMHQACAIHYKDPEIGSPMTSPLSTYFYQIHGLIEKWRQSFEAFTSIKSHERNFLLASQILFGLIDDRPGVVLGPDGPHPVDPGWGSLVAATRHEAKQAVIQMAVNRLSASLSHERASIVIEPVLPAGESAIGHAWTATENAMPNG
jgi:hypothetical protein